MSLYDYSNADEQKSQFDLIPNKSIVPVIVAIQPGDEGTPENAMKETSTGLYQLVLELTVTEGEFEKRKLWHRLTMGGPKGATLSEGQQKAVNISRATIRAMLEAGRGVAPTDESERAVAARKMESIFELEGLEFWIEVGIEKGGSKNDGTDAKYDDKNRLNKVMPWKEGQTAARGGQQQLQVGQGGAKSGGGAPAATKATGSGKKPDWA